jgi:hypothetical protein
VLTPRNGRRCETLQLDPAFFRAYLEFSSVPGHNGVLEPKIKELI